MSMWRKTILATALVGAGLASTTGAAFAGESSESGHEAGHSSHESGHHDARGKDCNNEAKAENGGHTTQSGLVNVDDVSTIVPINACNNNIPINALGVQVPIQDGSLNLPVLSGAGENGGNSAG